MEAVLAKGVGRGHAHVLGVILSGGSGTNSGQWSGVDPSRETHLGLSAMSGLGSGVLARPTGSYSGSLNTGLTTDGYWGRVRRC